MKILFINPVVRMEDVPKHVPYGIALLAKICDLKGYQVQVFDANAWRPSRADVARVLEADRWDVIGIGGISTTYNYTQFLLEEISRLPFNPFVILGGGIITSMPHDIMKLMPRLDLGVIGEAFQTLPEVLDRLAHGNRNWEDVKGVIWRDAQGQSHLNSPRELMYKLDELPYPAWEMFPLEEVYFPNSQTLFSEEGMMAQRRLDINSSYGCSLICRFCFHLGLTGDMTVYERDNNRDVVFTYERDIRYHSPDYIVNLIVYMKEKYSIDFISFFDENLMTMNVATGGTWLREICEKMISAGLQPPHIRESRPFDPKRDIGKGIHWSGTSHASLCNPEILNLMRQAGCSHLVYGLESFNDRVLKNIGKGTTARQNKEAIAMTLNNGIRPIPNQIIGFPDEWFDSIYDAMDAWDEMGVVVKPFFATPYPGSEWYYTYKDRILEQYNNDLDAFMRDLGDATNVTAVISQNFNSVELLGLRELMVRRDRRKIREYDGLWAKLHGQPKFPKFKSAGWRDRLEEFRSGERLNLYVDPIGQ
ncbi:MAG: B12-binding domain-containing radical SAM protein [Chloroflexi bacterium]|nr:B12-binding domain-containing radical SAM protein [Chloroflexota bacterium]